MVDIIVCSIFRASRRYYYWPPKVTVFTWAKDVSTIAAHEETIGLYDKLLAFSARYSVKLHVLWTESCRTVVVPLVAALCNLLSQNQVVGSIKILGAHRQRTSNEAGLNKVWVLATVSHRIIRFILSARLHNLQDAPLQAQWSCLKIAQSQ